MKAKELFDKKDFLPANLVQETIMIAGEIPMTCFCPAKCADIANKKFQAYLAKGRVVYGQIDGDGPTNFSALQVLDGYQGADTHTALLVQIEPIACEDSVEKVLAALAGWVEWDGLTVDDAQASKPTLFEIRDRARALLKEG